MGEWNLPRYFQVPSPRRMTSELHLQQFDRSCIP